MTEINSYLNDGANWQAQAVLAYLRWDSSEILSKTWSDKQHCYTATLKVGRYENCREQGYVFTIEYNGEQRHYAVYEHRNSDSLIVLIANGFSMDTPSVEFMWKEHTDENGNTSKYGYDKSFGWAEITKCCDFLEEDMKTFIDEIIEKEKK